LSAAGGAAPWPGGPAGANRDGNRGAKLLPQIAAGSVLGSMLAMLLGVVA
jgi:hypothetical protein